MSTPVGAVATRNLPHPARTVFAAWLDPAQFGKWMFPGDELLGLSADPVVGGRFCFTVRRHGHVLHHVGRYVRIEQARGLSFTWDVARDGCTADSVIDVMLWPSAAGCFVRVTRYLSPFPGLAEVAQHEADLRRMLDNLSEHLRQASTRPASRSRDGSLARGQAPGEYGRCGWTGPWPGTGGPAPA